MDNISSEDHSFSQLSNRSACFGVQSTNNTSIRASGHKSSGGTPVTGCRAMYHSVSVDPDLFFFGRVSGDTAAEELEAPSLFCLASRGGVLRCDSVSTFVASCVSHLPGIAY